MNDKSYKMQRLLTSADDLDAITENGIYWYYTESLPANVPFKNSAIVEVFEDKTDNTKKFSVLLDMVLLVALHSGRCYRALGGETGHAISWILNLIRQINSFGLAHLIKVLLPYRILINIPYSG